MKKLIALAFALLASFAHAQTFQTQNLTVAGSATLAKPAKVTTGKCPNLVAYGGVGDGLTDNSAAMTAALAANPAGKACVQIPSGVFFFASGINYSIPTSPGTLTITGDGSESTFLKFGNSGVSLLVSYKDAKSSAHLRDFSMLTTGAGTAIGIALIQSATAANGGAGQFALSDITGLTFRGADGWNGVDFWRVGIENDGVSNVNFVNDTFYGPTGTPSGNGIHLNFASDHTIIPVVDNIVGCSFTHLNVGLLYEGNTQGVTVSYSNFTANFFGIQVPSGASNVDQLSVSTSQFNNIGFSIDTEAVTQAVTISNNFFLIEDNSSAINLNDAAQFSVMNNVFMPNSAPPSNQFGVTIGAYAQGAGVIAGNSFDAITTGVRLLAGSGRVNVQSNAYAPTIGTAVSNAGATNTVGGGSQ